MTRRLLFFGLLALCAAWLAAPARSTAKTHTFQEEEVELTVPDDWHSIPPPDGAFGYFTDSSEKRAVVLTVSDLPKGVPIDPNEFVLGARNSAAAMKSSILEEGKLTLGALRFLTLKAGSAPGATPNLYMCTTFVNESALTISMRGIGLDPSVDPELDAILRSFRFLTAPKPVAVVSPGAQVEGFFARYLLPLIGGTIVIAGAITTLVVFLVRRYRAQPAPFQEPVQKF